MANKCLELGYFPRAWKVAAIKVIPKPGKEDYARPKSYRPIGLLPVLGKTVERMLVGASNHINGVIGHRGRLRQRVVAGVGDPAARPWLPGEPPWPGPRLPSGPGGSRQVRWRECRKGTSKGCIRFYSRSNLWNLILDSLLRELGELGVYVQAFADDVVLMFSGQSASSIEEEANRASSCTAGESEIS
ncbi:Putative 115 kDa protein in type-1 retrotransposable element R1DM [Eumeta japonica]|uniref:115 kDa protein in type-1 retrotransposable element R1DM n=1 Tax=Eumeta variegata TaxID=151549 RepID=A0A4C2AFM2_EUMVA|nr:Putative 115 kDa protein in type-1 retrotransposable element R1DM [Eumeta japonica]